VGGALFVGSSHLGVGFMVDLSERRRIEREHAALVEAEQIFRERLLGIVGHDLRNPLAAIDSWVQLLKLSPALGASERTAAVRIGGSVERMRRMIEQLLDFTRARQAGGIPIAPRVVDLGAICRGVVEELASAHPGRLDFHAEGADLVGHWDGDRLAQVVSNLAGNALRHGDGGSITLRAFGAAGSVRLDVHNSGRAIPAADLPYLFDPYRRGRSASHGTGDNLGLGLYIVQQIVRAHGGSIRVHSTDAEGTTFTVELPRRRDGE
jgi:signal transduction histidine kinase